MNNHSSFILLFSFLLLSFSCVTNETNIIITPAYRNDISWLNGKEYQEKKVNNITCKLSFDSIDNNKMLFSVIILNQSKHALLIDPSKFYYYPLSFLPNTPDEVIINKNNAIYAFDPEIILQNIKHQINSENSSYDTDQTIDTAAGCLGSVGGFTAKDEYSRKSSMDLRNDATESSINRNNLHISRMSSYNKKYDTMSKTLLRKHSLLPLNELSGIIYFQHSADINHLLISIPVGNKECHFIYNQIIDNE